MRYILTLLLFACYFQSACQDSTAFTRQEIIYGRKDGLAMTMLALQPTKSNQRAIVSIVSGNWISSLRNQNRWVEISKMYIEKGYTVFLVAHGAQPRYSLQDAAADIKRAVQFIRYNAAQYKIDPNHIGVLGSSSGGHLALMAGLADNTGNPNASDPVERVSGKVQAVACFFPPTDFLNYGTDGMKPSSSKPMLQQLGVLGAFTFREYDSTKKVYVEITDSARITEIARSMSPAQLVTSDDPPVMIWHGDKDFIVPLQQSKILQPKFEALKIPFVLKVKPGAGHGWESILTDERDFIGWFDKHLKLRTQ
jgi:acetyl esterase/lipase